MKKNQVSEQQGKLKGANPSPVGTQQNPVSAPRRNETNSVEKELEEREKFLKEQASKSNND